MISSSHLRAAGISIALSAGSLLLVHCSDQNLGTPLDGGVLLFVDHDAACADVPTSGAPCTIEGESCDDSQGNVCVVYDEWECHDGGWIVDPIHNDPSGGIQCPSTLADAIGASCSVNENSGCPVTENSSCTYHCPDGVYVTGSCRSGEALTFDVNPCGDGGLDASDPSCADTLIACIGL